MPSKAIPWIKVVVHIICLMPVVGWVMMARNGQLAQLADPVQALTHWTGDWAIWLLLADLAITPVRRLSPKVAWLIWFRRLLGLYAFFYATLHLSVYVFLFSGYDMATAIVGVKTGHPAEMWRQLVAVWPTMRDDVLQRKFIQVGLFAWLVLLALAVTSPQRVLRAMGGKNWQRLHRLIYAAGAAAVIHYWWLVKAGVRSPWKVTAVLVVLLGARVVYSVTKRRKAASA